MPETPLYLAKIEVKQLTNNGEAVETTVRARGVEELKRKVATVLSVIEEGDLS